MADDEKSDGQTDGHEETDEEKGGGQKIMCFVSKEMVPINETVEVEYKPGRKVRVLPKYVKFDMEGEAAAS